MTNKPGTDPEPVTGDLPIPKLAYRESDAKYIGVVDSGIDPAKLPTWMEEPEVFFEAFDEETTDPSPTTPPLWRATELSLQA